MKGDLNRSDLLKRLPAVKTPLMIVACAFLILLFTGQRKESAASQDQFVSKNEEISVEDQELRLSETLQKIDGVGNARVLLSCRISSRTEYVTDDGETVVLSAGSGRKEALSACIRSPEYLGAVIVCEGGDDPNVKWNVSEAVSRFTGLRADLAYSAVNRE